MKTSRRPSLLTSAQDAVSVGQKLNIPAEIVMSLKVPSPLFFNKLFGHSPPLSSQAPRNTKISIKPSLLKSACFAFKPPVIPINIALSVSSTNPPLPSDMNNLTLSINPYDEQKISRCPSLLKSSVIAAPANPLTSTPKSTAKFSKGTNPSTFSSNASNGIKYSLGTSVGYLPNVMYAIFINHLLCKSSG